MVPRPGWQPFSGPGATGCLARAAVCCVSSDVPPKQQPKRCEAASDQAAVPQSRAVRFLEKFLSSGSQVHQLPKARPYSGSSRLPRSASAVGASHSVPSLERGTSKQNSATERSGILKPQQTKESVTGRQQQRMSRSGSAPSTRHGSLRSEAVVDKATARGGISGSPVRRSSTTTLHGALTRSSAKVQPVAHSASLVRGPVRRSSITTLLKNQFYSRQEARQREKLIEFERKVFNKSVKKMLDRLSGTSSKRVTSPESSRSGQSTRSASMSERSSVSDLCSDLSNEEEQKAQDEEELVAALRRSDLEVGLRLRAILCLARMLAEHVNDPGSKNKVEICELGDSILQEKEGMLKEPWAALELAELCEQSLSLPHVADTIYDELEQVVLQSSDVHYTYMLLDLAQRHHRKGDKDAARALFEYARAMPSHIRDPRCRSRFYEWRFDEECVVADDIHCVHIAGATADESLKFFRPVGGLQADCACGRGALSQAATGRLKEWRQSAGNWNRSGWERCCEDRVAKAEELVGKVSQSASCLDDRSKLIELSLADIRTAGEHTTHAAQIANAELAVARTFITAKQIEAKAKDSSDTIDKLILQFHMRLSTAEAEVNKTMKLLAFVAQQLTVKACAEVEKRNVDHAIQKLTHVERCVKIADELVSEMTECDRGGIVEMVKESTAACCRAGAEIKDMEHFLASQANVLGISELESMKFTIATTNAKKSIEECKLKLRETSEKLDVEQMLSESKKRVEAVSEACSHVQVMESQMALEVDVSLEQVPVALEDLDVAAADAQMLLDDTQAFLRMKLLAAKRLVVENASNLAIEGLSQLQNCLDDAVTSLREVRNAIDRRKILQSRCDIANKIADSVSQVQAVSDAAAAINGVETFAVDKVTADYERIEFLRGEAQQTLADAFALLARKQCEIKGSDVEIRKFRKLLSDANSKLITVTSELADFRQDVESQKLTANVASKDDGGQSGTDAK